MAVVHLAARETFAQDGQPACGARRGFNHEVEAIDGGFHCTHTLTDTTCRRCQRTAEFKRAKRLGLTENDETWAETR
jgi:hypothetical protein